MKEVSYYLAATGRLLLVGLCSMGFAVTGLAGTETVQALWHLNIEGQARRGVRECERYLAIQAQGEARVPVNPADE